MKVRLTRVEEGPERRAAPASDRTPKIVLEHIEKRLELSWSQPGSRSKAMANIKVDGTLVEVPDHYTLMQAAEAAERRDSALLLP